MSTDSAKDILHLIGMDLSDRRPKPELEPWQIRYAVYGIRELEKLLRNYLLFRAYEEREG